MMVNGQQGLAFYNALIKHPVVSPTGATPSYISSEQFSTGVLHLLGAAGEIPTAASSLRIAAQNMPDSPFKKVVTSMFREGEDDLQKVETRLQRWFDQSMDRVSGIYKRWSQYISLFLGVLLAFVFQVDAIRIAKGLWNEPDCCGAITTAASASAKSENSALHGLSQFDLTPIWDNWSKLHLVPNNAETISLYVGCAITAVAVSLGAPFWFDTLQTFVSLRGTGPEPQSSSSTAKN